MNLSKFIIFWLFETTDLILGDFFFMWGGALHRSPKNLKFLRQNLEFLEFILGIHKILLVSLHYKHLSLFALSFSLLMLDSSYVVLPEELSFILFDCEVIDDCVDENLESKLRLLQKALENNKAIMNSLEK